MLSFTYEQQKSRSYDVWFTRYKVQRTRFFGILDHFFPLTLLTTQKVKNFEKIKTLPGDIIIFHFCTTNDDHIM